MCKLFVNTPSADNLNIPSSVELQPGILDVDPIKELSQILVGHLGALVDQGTGPRYVVQVVADHSQDVLLLLLLGNGHSVQGIHPLVHLDAHKVLNLQGPAALDDVSDDREMRVGKNHLELVPRGHSPDHVVNDAPNGAQDGCLLSLLHPDLEEQLLLLGFVVSDLSEVEGDVPEGPGELAERSLDGDLPGLDGDSDALGDVELLLGEDVLHSVGENN